MENRPAFFTSTGAGGRKMRGGVLGLALVGLSPTSNDSFRAHQRGPGGTTLFQGMFRGHLDADAASLRVDSAYDHVQVASEGEILRI